VGTTFIINGQRFVDPHFCEHTSDGNTTYEVTLPGVSLVTPSTAVGESFIDRRPIGNWLIVPVGGDWSKTHVYAHKTHAGAVEFVGETEHKARHYLIKWRNLTNVCRRMTGDPWSHDLGLAFARLQEMIDAGEVMAR